MSTLTLLFALVLATPALPGVNLAGIDKNETEALNALLNDAVCPCSPNETVLQCIKKKSCPPAVELANFGADQFRQGLSIEQVMQAMVRRYIEKYVRYKFDLASSPRKGAANAKVTIVEFADFECPHCAEMSKILDGLVKKYQGHRGCLQAVSVAPPHACQRCCTFSIGSWSPGEVLAHARHDLYESGQSQQ